MSRLRIVFLILAVAALACLGWVLYETNRIVVERVDLSVAGLPAAFEGFRIVQLTDFHGRRLDPAGPVFRAVSAAEPDIIALTGDYVRRTTAEFANITGLLQALSEICPVYAVSGNHDHWAGWEQIAAGLAECGAAVLDNAHVMLRRADECLILAGVGDPHTRHDDLGAALPAGPDGGDPPIVVLVHSPSWWESRKHGTLAGGTVEVGRQHDAPTDAELGRISVALAGHTHGGQIRLPVIGALSNASGRIFPRDYISGLSVEEGGALLYISRGLGFSIVPLRFLAPAEVTVITLRSSTSP